MPGHLAAAAAAAAAARNSNAGDGEGPHANSSRASSGHHAIMHQNSPHSQRREKRGSDPGKRLLDAKTLDDGRLYGRASSGQSSGPGNASPQPSSGSTSPALMPWQQRRGGTGAQPVDGFLSSASGAAAPAAPPAEHSLVDSISTWFSTSFQGGDKSDGPQQAQASSSSARAGSQVVIDCSEVGGASRSATWTMNADLTLRDARDSAAQRFGLHADAIEICHRGVPQNAPWEVNVRLGSLKELDTEPGPLYVQVRPRM